MLRMVKCLAICRPSKYINVDTKLYHTSQKLGFVTIQRQNPLSCEVTNVTGRYMDTVLDLDRG